MIKPRLLVVEDETVISMDLQRRLRKLGYEVLACVGSGKEALQQAEDCKPDLILMDITLEGEEDGITTAREIQRRHDIPILFLTAHTDTHTLNRLKEAGAPSCLIKPIRDQELVPAIELACVSRLRRAWSLSALEFLLSRASDAAIVAHGAEQRISYLNNAALEILNCEPGQAMGRKLSETFRIEDLASGTVSEQQLGQWLSDLSANGVSRPVMVTSNNNNKRWVEVSVIRLISQEDIHDVLLFHESRGIRIKRNSHKGGGVKLLEALASAEVGVWKWNAPAGRFHGFATQGHNQDQAAIESNSLEAFAQTIHMDDRNEFLRAFREAQKAATTVEIETRMVSVDGARWVTFFGAPTTSGNEAGIYAGIWKHSPEVARDRMQLTILRKALEKVRQGVTVADMHGKILYVNQLEAEMHGYSPEELIGRQAGILGWEELRQQPPSRSAQPWKRKTVNQKKDGSLFSVMLTTEMIFDERDAPLFQITISEKIPDEVNEDELRQISLALEQTTSAILITDTNGNIQYVNQSLCEMTGYLREEIIGRRPSIFKSGNHDQDFYQELWATIRDGRSWRGTILNKRKNGDVYFNECQISPLLDHNGVITHFVSTGRDITEETKMREQLKRKESMELMGRLVAGVAHEVRNPLSVIQASIDACRTEDAPDSEWVVSLNLIRSQVKRLSVLMKDLLELGKPLQESRLQNESVSTLCRTVLSAIRKTFPDHTFVLADPDEDRFFVRVDSAGLYQVLYNLLENAAQHSPKEGTIQIEVSEEGGSQVCISVRDQGSGIPRENFLQLFEPFFSTRQGGTGLGLCIVRHIVEAHGGYVLALNNDPPPGVTFEVHLPGISSSEMS